MVFVEETFREISFFALKHLWHFLFLDHVLGNEIDQ